MISGFDSENCLFVDIDIFGKNYLNSKTNKFPIDLQSLLVINFDEHNNNLNINIANNTIFSKPIYLINNINCNFNIIINVGDNSQLTIIDHKQNQNSITKIICERYSVLDYYVVQNMDNSKLYIQQNINSKFMAKILANNSNDNKLQLELNLLEANTFAELNVLQNTKHTYIHSVDLLINHLTTGSSSYTLTRTIAADQSSANLNGKIVVHKSAKKTQANLQNKSLILSKQASIISCPELLIDNNDVIFTHGSSVGNLDANALFYIQTRGISLKDASQMLLQAFLQPIIQKIKYPEIVNYLDCL